MFHISIQKEPNSLWWKKSSIDLNLRVVIGSKNGPAYIADLNSIEQIFEYRYYLKSNTSLIWEYKIGFILIK